MDRRQGGEGRAHRDEGREVTDAEGIRFLQWSLPRLGLRWRGFRKVRRIVYRRIERRLAALGLADVAAYVAYLESHPGEWEVLDGTCRIPLSRFYRDRAVFEFLERVVLPALGAAVVERGERELRCWSAGCAAGEEPYTLAIIWRLRVAPRLSGLRARIVATDAEPEMIARAAGACYPAHALRDLPIELAERALRPSSSGLRVSQEFRDDVEFLVQDIRVAAPEGRFHLILCRNLVFTYFDEALQRRTLARLVDKLEPGGALVAGVTETIPAGLGGLVPWSGRLRIYRAHGPSLSPAPSGPTVGAAASPRAEDRGASTGAG
jgi:chemotaxis protein methyltransferase CheR